MDRMLGTQPRITVLETRGDSYAFQPVVEREKIPPSYGMLTSAKGSAKVQMPDGVVYELGADTSVEFKLEEAASKVRVAAAKKAATPSDKPTFKPGTAEAPDDFGNDEKTDAAA